VNTFVGIIFSTIAIYLFAFRDEIGKKIGVKFGVKYDDMPLANIKPMRYHNVIFNEDCLVTLEKDIQYHYVITHLPDLSYYNLFPLDLNISGDSSEIWDICRKKYMSIVASVLRKLNPLNKVMTIIINYPIGTLNTGLFHKMSQIKGIMKSVDYELLSHKRWKKQEDVDSRYLSYAVRDVLNFGKRNNCQCLFRFRTEYLR